MNLFKRTSKPTALAVNKFSAPSTFPYNPRNASYKVEPDIHVKAVVYIVDANGNVLTRYCDYVHSFDITEIDRHGKKLIERYNRMLDLNDRLNA